MCEYSYPAAHAHRGCGCGTATYRPFRRQAHRHYPGEGAFGVRRPLRFLAWKLDLDEAQVAELAAILHALKTERAQSEVDDRRALALLADAAEGEVFQTDRAAEAIRVRAQGAERLQRKVAESLERIHALLRPEQRDRLAYLLRTGTLLM